MHFAHAIEFRTLLLIHFGWTKPDTEEPQINLCFGFADIPAQSARRKQRGIAILDLNSQQWQRNSTVSEHYEPEQAPSGAPQPWVLYVCHQVQRSMGHS